MSNGKSLSSGGFKPPGSLSNIVVVVLVVVVLILCAGVFMLYNQEKGANNDATSAKKSLADLNTSYSELSGKYSALVASNADLGERFDLLEEEYRNTSANYAQLKNQSDSTTVRLGEFLESDPTVAYTYRMTSSAGDNNSTILGLKVNVYNVYKADINNVVVVVKVIDKTTGDLGELTKTITLIPSLSSRTVEWELDNVSQVQSVWVGIG